MKFRFFSYLIITICLITITNSSTFAQTKQQINTQLAEYYSQFLGNRFHNPHYDNPPQSPSILPIGEGESNNGKIKIQNFRPISDLVQATSPTSYTSVTSPRFTDISPELKQYALTQRPHYFHAPCPDNTNYYEGNDYYFEFSVDILNNTDCDELELVILYENQTYKHSEAFEGNNGYLTFRTGDNFYGSWGFEEKNNSGLRSIIIPRDSQYHTYEGIFRLRGNPKNNISFMSNVSAYNSWQDPINTGNRDYLMNRWKDFLRMGTYEFLVVVTSSCGGDGDFDENDPLDLPFLIDPTKPYIQYNNNTERDYLSPFYWKMIIGSEFTERTAVAEGTQQLKLVTQVDFSVFNNTDYSVLWDSNNGFSQNIAPVKVIPMVASFDEFTQLDYNWATNFYNKADLATVYLDSASNQNSHLVDDNNGNFHLELINPSSNYCEFKREYAGVSTRPRLKYGKFRGKIRFPKMFTSNNIRKGYHNTFWLSGMPNDNNCASPTGNVREEFDIEMFYSKSHCQEDDPNTCNPSPGQPGCYYHDGNPDEIDENKQYNISEWFDSNPDEEGEIKVILSNFDWYCDDVDTFIPEGSCFNLQKFGKNFHYERWPNTINTSLQRVALHSTTPEFTFDNQIFSDVHGEKEIYYEIEWTPTELIFRIAGIEVGYFNSNFTRISRSPMSLVIAQHSFGGDPPTYTEAHNTRMIPFWSDPNVGEILEITIE